MPLFRLETNLPKSKIPADFAKSTGSVLAKTLGREERDCLVIVVPDTHMWWGDKNEPSGFATLLSVGQLGSEENKKHSKALHDHVTKALGIANPRFSIYFIDANASNIGYQGTTYEEYAAGLSKQ